MKKMHKVLSLLILVCVAILTYLYAQNNWIEIENFYIERKDIPQAYDGFKIIHISDVHLPKNASNIENIIALVKKQNPDIILITGDIIDKSADIQNCKLDEFCKELTKITDVYAVAGNHEVWGGNLSLWKQILAENNVRVMDNRFEIIERNQEKLAILGLSDNTPYSPEVFENSNEMKRLFCLMLAHRPELFSTYTSNEHSILPDMIFSGHAHGGQFRIPFAGGLFAPGQGFFPRYSSGMYLAEDNKVMIVSRGLGSSIIPLRINNRPHLPVITLKSSRDVG